MTVFDIVTVACFIGIVALFFAFSDGKLQTLFRFLLASAILAIANQTGNHGYSVVAAALIAAAMALVVTQFSNRV